MLIGFDLDGTLINSIPLHQEAFLHSAKLLGWDITLQQLQKTMSMTEEQMLRELRKDVTPEETKEFVSLKQKYTLANISQMKPFSDTVSTLECLRQAHSILILSNSTYHEILTFLEAAQLNPLFFELIVGRDLITHPKPEPDEFFLAQRVEHHKLDFFVGDSTVDIIAGNKAGAKTIGVVTGFNTRKELEAVKPHAVVDTLSEILDLVKQ